MPQLALGLIETVGLAAGIEAADTAVKSADVKLLGYELTNGGEYVGMVTIKFVGDVSAVKAAVDAGAAAAERVTEVWSVDVIPRPHVELGQVIETEETVGLEDKIEASELESIEEMDEEVTSDIEGEEDEIGIEDRDEVEGDEIDEGAEDEGKENIKDEKEEDRENKAEDEVEKVVEEEDTEIVEELTKQDKKEMAMEEADKEENDEEADKEDDEVIEKQAELEIDQEETEEQEEVCNLCGDPDCLRRKGDLHVNCIHYDEIKE